MPEQNKDAGLRTAASRSGGAMPNGNNYLVAIGIDTYQYCPRLYNAVGDARAVVEELTSYFQFDKGHVTTLYNEAATQKNISETLDRLADTLQPGDTLVLYYSGHGEYKEKLDEGYWIPVDGKADELLTCIPNAVILKYLKAIQSFHTFVVVDACFSGSLFAERSVKGLERQENVPSRWLLSAGRNEVVSDGKPGDNSPFADNFLYFLRQNRAGDLGVGELCRLVVESVASNATQNPRGEPLRDTGHKGGQMVLHGRLHKAHAEPPANAEPATAGAEPDDITRGGVIKPPSPAIISPKPQAAAEEGFLWYEIPSRMRVQQPTTCKVRIATQKDNLGTEATGKQNQSLRISRVMSVELVDVSGGQCFTIVEGSTEEQYLDDQTFTEWLFFVTPLKAGTFPLLLKISTVQIIDAIERKKDITHLQNISIEADATQPPMKNIEEIRQSIKMAIADNLEAGIKQFKDLLQSGSGLFNDLVLQQSRFNSTNRSLMQGLITGENANLTFNQIRAALLYMTDQLKESDLKM